jgi:hypothetical protein
MIEALCYNLEVVGSFPNEVFGPSYLPNPSSRTVALRLTKLLTEMSTRNFPGGRG